MGNRCGWTVDVVKVQYDSERFPRVAFGGRRISDLELVGSAVTSYRVLIAHDEQNLIEMSDGHIDL